MWHEAFLIFTSLLLNSLPLLLSSFLPHSPLVSFCQSRATSIFSYLGVYGTAAVGVAVFALKERSDAANAGRVAKAKALAAEPRGDSSGTDESCAQAGGGAGMAKQRKGRSEGPSEGSTLG